MTLEADIIGVQTCKPATKGLWRALYRARADAHWRGGLWLRRWLPAHCALGHAGAGGWLPAARGGPGVDGYAGGGPHHPPAAGIGSKVVLWGEGVAIETVADAAGTIGYELMCAVAPRVPLVEVGS